MSNTNRREHRKLIDKDTEIYIQNNTHGSYFWESPHKTSMVKFEGQGDEDIMTFGDLRVMVAQSRKLFKDMRLIISEVIDDEYTILDVAKALHLDDTYNSYFDDLLDLGAKNIDTSYRIDAEDIVFFIQESDMGDFKKVLKTNLKNTLIETTMSMNTVDSNKSDTVAKLVNTNMDDDILSDIKASQVG
ncbi:hypothetical protein [Liquorilactobacillus hordei]|uniref:Uncharacterized protein n=1 Tax=Liquorilactobacillus hordei DSM 19519 TaxID=1423759 RepID=A0A0R1MRV5_9LACO|nr:hypothetical protein [Liquorilactobacillus hordei]KRL07922.1 hypothetical protein FC92_GL000989 [Liquorilactobacillus hordei DSM 19519]QYH51131.1 hypothetical protein G6O70_00810 [Liquorilactobacillus hordei DSM 19519]